MEVLPVMLSSLVLASYWREERNQVRRGREAASALQICVQSTSTLLSRPKNMSEEMALAFANFCRASLDSDTATGTSAFLLLGSLGQTTGDEFLT